MKADTSRPSAAARAEAAAWIARLHGPNRTPEAEAGFRRWMAEDPEHAAAMELLTDVWEKSARLQRRPFERVASWEFPGFRMSFSRAAFGAMLIAFAAAVGTVFYLHTDALSTAVGEQRSLTLEDGTHVFLNTDTVVVARYEKAARRVELRKGEAMFEVAKQPGWPFIVTAGGKQVSALGTAFVVRRNGNDLEVTLVEGKVAVSEARTGDHQSNAPSSSNNASSTLNSAEHESLSRGVSSSDVGHGDAPTVPPAHPREREGVSAPLRDEVFMLSPGQRLTFVSTRAPKLDTPPMELITAWQRGQVALDEMPLADAVEEMNRYSTTQLIVKDRKSAAILISGIFRAGDQQDFAKAVAKTYQLEIRTEPRKIVLSSVTDGAHGTAQP